MGVAMDRCNVNAKKDGLAATVQRVFVVILATWNMELVKGIDFALANQDGADLTAPVVIVKMVYAAGAVCAPKANVFAMQH